MKTEELLKLAELAKAERDGETIQVRVFSPDRGPHWVNRLAGQEWHPSIEDYRIKPEPRVIWVNEYQNGKGEPYLAGAWHDSEAGALMGSHVARNQLRIVKFVEVLDFEPKQTAFKTSVEDLITHCVPEGPSCNPEEVAYRIRAYFEAKEGGE